MLFAPLGEREGVGGGASYVRMIDTEGPSLAYVAAIPVGIALIALALQWTPAALHAQVLGALFLGMFAFFGYTVGLFFIPAALVMAFAAYWGWIRELGKQIPP